MVIPYQDLHYLLAVIFFFFIKFEHFYEYLIQFPLILGGTKDHFRWAKVPDTAPY